jgi:hypothetical protein
LIPRKYRGSLTRLPPKGYDLISSVDRQMDGYHSSERDMKRESVIFSQSGRRPPWPAPSARRRASALTIPTAFRSDSNPNRERRSQRTYLSKFKRATTARGRNETRGGRRHHCRCFQAHQKPRFDASHHKRKAREERGGDSDLTDTKKRSSHRPTSPTDDQPKPSTS